MTPSLPTKQTLRFKSLCCHSVRRGPAAATVMPPRPDATLDIAAGHLTLPAQPADDPLSFVFDVDELMATFLPSAAKDTLALNPSMPIERMLAAPLFRLSTEGGGRPKGSTKFPLQDMLLLDATIFDLRFDLGHELEERIVHPDGRAQPAPPWPVTHDVLLHVQQHEDAALFSPDRWVAQVVLNGEPVVPALNTVAHNGADGLVAFLDAMSSGTVSTSGARGTSNMETLRTAPLFGAQSFASLTAGMPTHET